MRLQLNEIREEAVARLHDEINEKAVAEEMARLRALQGRTLWQRLTQALPFTITWKK